MREQKYYLAFDEFERGITIRSLNELRNHLLLKGRYTDVVDKLLKNLQSPKKEIQNYIRSTT